MTTYQKVYAAISDALGGIGRHVFEVGYSKCKYCNEPRIVVDRKVRNLAVDEKSGGSVVEVDEKRYDQTTFPCKQNTHTAIHLEDVLRAISTIGGRKGIIAVETPDAKKYDIEEFYVDTMVAKILTHYNLSLPFSEQSEELYLFLKEILCLRLQHGRPEGGGGTY